MTPYTLHPTIRWDKSLGGRRIALFHFPPKDESLLRLVVGDELQLRLDAAAARLYGEHAENSTYCLCDIIVMSE